MKARNDFILIPSHAEMSDPDMREYIELWVKSQSNIGIGNSYRLLAGQAYTPDVQAVCDMLVREAERRLGFAYNHTPDF